jgi:hypothetical protein
MGPLVRWETLLVVMMVRQRDAGGGQLDGKAKLLETDITGLLLLIIIIIVCGAISRFIVLLPYVPVVAHDDAAGLAGPYTPLSRWDWLPDTDRLLWLIYKFRLAQTTVLRSVGRNPTNKTVPVRYSRL